MNNRARLGAASVTAAAFAISAAWASRHGADPGYTAGPASFGATCAACHPFATGGGGVEIIDAPRRYVPGQTYPIAVRVFDPQKLGAGFQISAESILGHRGTLIVTDATRTQLAEFGTNPSYITHTQTGVNDSVAEWAALGSSYEYSLSWQAPTETQDDVTFFVSANAISNSAGAADEHYYAAVAQSQLAMLGDADADADFDLFDFAALQNCVSLEPLLLPDDCHFLDVDEDGSVSPQDGAQWAPGIGGPTATIPGEYVLADAVRGGRLYDNWWITAGLPEPQGDHPLYPEEGQQSGGVTFRCKECHGWDYEGVDGAYGSGSHFTGISGVLGTDLSPTAIFELLAADPNVLPNGHNMSAYGLGDDDLWALAKFVSEGVMDTSGLINASGDFIGEQKLGGFWYGFTCIYCHGADGQDLDFGEPGRPEYVGTLANANPWELLHKIRFGHPGSPMPATDLLGWSAVLLNDLGAFCQTLPN